MRLRLPNQWTSHRSIPLREPRPLIVSLAESPPPRHTHAYRPAVSFGFPRSKGQGCPAPNPATVFANLRDPGISDWVRNVMAQLQQQSAGGVGGGGSSSGFDGLGAGLEAMLQAAADAQEQQAAAAAAAGGGADGGGGGAGARQQVRAGLSCKGSGSEAD